MTNKTLKAKIIDGAMNGVTLLAVAAICWIATQIIEIPAIKRTAESTEKKVDALSVDMKDTCKELRRHINQEPPAKLTRAIEPPAKTANVASRSVQCVE
jgi:hypothetical protein